MSDLTPEIIQVLTLAEAGKALMADIGLGTRSSHAPYYARRDAVTSARRAGMVDQHDHLTPTGASLLARARR